MKEKTVIVPNETGLHARPSSQLVEEANEYEAEIKFIGAGERVNAKSLMSVMALVINQGEQITIQAKGEDAKAAVDSLAAIIEDGFGEM